MIRVFCLLGRMRDEDGDSFLPVSYSLVKHFIEHLQCAMLVCLLSKYSVIQHHGRSGKLHWELVPSMKQWQKLTNDE